MKTNGMFFAASILAFPIMVAPALAQDNSGEIQEIVVTAQRQAQTLTEVPNSVQAFTGPQLISQGISSFTDLQFVTPGYLPNTASGFTEIYIRGIGNDIYSGADPSVATFVDDVPHIWGSSSDSLLDVERVEVLKGAQGGLYGRNATGGVVNVITRQPNTDQLEGNSLLDYGEKGTVRVGTYLNLPVNDRIAVSVAGERDKHDAYVTNYSTDSIYTPAMFPSGSAIGGSPQATANLLNSFQRPVGLNSRDFWATDSKLLFKVTDNFKVTIAGDYQAEDDSAGQGYYTLAPAITQANLNGLLTAFGFNPSLPPNFVSQHGNFTGAVGNLQNQRLDESGVSVTAVWNAPLVDVTSITAFRDQHSAFISGTDAGPAVDAGVEVDNHRHYWYQEFRGVSTWDGPFHLIGGATYLHSSFDGSVAINIFDGLATIPTVDSQDSVKNWSAYLQGAYDITRDLSLTVSGREVHETNSGLFTAPVVSGNNATEDKFLPSATLSYKLDDGNVYARWAKGWKAGGINPTAAPVYFPNPRDGSIFGPEQVDTYEVGYRQTLFDRKVQLTTAVFYNDYRNVQISDHGNAAYANTIILAIVNGGDARTWGAEEDLSWRVINPLTLGVGAGYLNAKYDNFSLLNNPVLANFDLSGTTMLDAPTWQINLNGDLDQPLNDKLRLVGHVLTTYISRVLFYQSGAPGVVPPAEGPAYWLTNLRLGVRTSDDKYGIAVYANNLFDRAYYVWGQSSTTSTFVNWGNPRIVGGEITVKF